MTVRRVAFTIACVLAAAHLLAADAVKSRQLLASVERRASALMAENKPAEAEREFVTMLTLARQVHDVTREARALNNIGYLQYSRGAMAETDRDAADLLARRAWQVVVARRWAVVEVFEDGVFVVDLQHDRAGAAQPGRHEVELAVVGVLHAQP